MTSDRKGPDLERLVGEITVLTDRVARLEGQVAAMVAAAPPAAGPFAPPAPAAAPSVAVAPPAPAVAGAPPAPPAESLESQIGGLWLNRIGVVALVAALAFFLKYAFDHDWINEYGRLAIGAVGGIILLAGGEYYYGRGRMPRFGVGLGCAGLAAFYVTIYAASEFYYVIDSPLAKILMSAVTLSALALSVRRRVAVFAGLGLVGGYLTPPLFAGGGTVIDLYVYVGVLTAILVAVTVSRRWPGLGILSLPFAYALCAAGRAMFPVSLTTYIIFLSLLHLMFMASGPLSGLIMRRPAGPALTVLSALSSFLYILMASLTLHPGHPTALGLILIGWAAACFGIMAAAPRWGDRGMAAWTLLLGFIYVAVAVPFGLEARWVTVVWLLQSLVFVALGMWKGVSQVRWLGVGLLLVTAAKLLLVDLAGLETAWRILVFLASGLIFLLASYLYQRYFRVSGRGETREV